MAKGWVRNKIAAFHDTLNSLEQRQCVSCKETWPTGQGLNAQRYIECLRCKRDKEATKLFSSQNDMDPGTVPNELKNLTEIEEMRIARACTIMCVYRKHGGQRGYKGHVLNFPKDIQNFFPRLPPSVAELPFLIIRRYGVDNTHRDCRVRRHKVMQGITWYKDNNPYYSDIVIDEESLQRLPHDDGVPEIYLHFIFKKMKKKRKNSNLLIRELFKIMKMVVIRTAAVFFPFNTYSNREKKQSEHSLMVRRSHQ